MSKITIEARRRAQAQKMLAEMRTKVEHLQEASSDVLLWISAVEDAHGFPLPEGRDERILPRDYEREVAPPAPVISLRGDAPPPPASRADEILRVTTARLLDELKALYDAAAYMEVAGNDVEEALG